MVQTLGINIRTQHNPQGILLITNKLKINDSKRECIVLRSPQWRCGFSGLLVNVGERQIIQSLKMRDLGVIFDQCLNFDDHITDI